MFFAVSKKRNHLVRWKSLQAYCCVCVWDFMDDIEPDGMVVHNFLFSTQAMLGGAWKALGKAMEAGNFERAPKNVLDPETDLLI